MYFSLKFSLISLWFTEHFKQKWIRQIFFFLLAADRSNLLAQTTRPDYLLDPDHHNWPDQTRPDRPLEETGFVRLGFLPQLTQPDQLPLTDHPARPASSTNTHAQHGPGRHCQLRITGQNHSLWVGSWEVNILSTHLRLEVPGLLISVLLNRR